MSESQTPPAESVRVHPLLGIMIEQLATVAWSKLGLQPDPMSRKIEKDLPEAKVAIDAIAALAPLLESALDEDDRRQIQGLLRDLRINYVQHAGSEA